jgi:hypothetical protein
MCCHYPKKSEYLSINLELLWGRIYAQRKDSAWNHLRYQI